MGFSVMLGRAEKLVPAEYWCPYGTVTYNLSFKYHNILRHRRSGAPQLSIFGSM